MKFEYNGNLEENKRILKVANEIIEYYPEIDFDKAKLIASLEGPITTKENYEMIFMRLFNILFICQNDKNVFNIVYHNLLNIYNIDYDNDLINSMMNELNRFVLNERSDFPIISEFY